MQDEQRERIEQLERALMARVDECRGSWGWNVQMEWDNGKFRPSVPVLTHDEACGYCTDALQALGQRNAAGDSEGDGG